MAARVERQRGLLRRSARHERAQHEADEQARHDPPDRAEHADQRELLFLRLDVVERERVGEAERRHVAEIVEQQQQDERGGVPVKLRDGEAERTPPRRCSTPSTFSVAK